MRYRLVILSLSIFFTIVLGAVALTAFYPVQFNSNEEIFEIPAGTWERRMAGDKVEILPESIYLALGVREILVLRNQDKVPQMFGPTLIMPGQSFKLPFDLASDYQFACTAHASGQMTVIVDPEPTPGLPRLEWRVKKLLRQIKVGDNKS